MIACHIDTIPLITRNGIIDDVMRPAFGVDERDGVATVGVNQIVDNQRARVSTRDSDTTIARAAAISEDPIELHMNILVLVVASEQRYRLASGSGDGQSTDCDEFGLL